MPDEPLTDEEEIELAYAEAEKGDREQQARQDLE